MSSIAVLLLIASLLCGLLNAAPAANEEPKPASDEAVKVVMHELKDLSERIEEYEKKLADKVRIDKECIKGIVIAKDRLENALKPLIGQKPESTGPGEDIQAKVSETINDAKEALQDLSVKDAKKLKEIAAEHASKTPEEQERVLKEYADKQGDKVKEAVKEVLEAKEKAADALEDHVKKQTASMSVEARKASEQVLLVMEAKNVTADEKVKKVEEVVAKLPEPVKEEMNVKNLDEVKQFIQAQSNLHPLVQAGLQTGPAAAPEAAGDAAAVRQPGRAK